MDRSVGGRVLVVFEVVNGSLDGLMGVCELLGADSN